MTLDEVLTSPSLSEADRLVYALQIGNGEVTHGELLDALAASLEVPDPLLSNEPRFIDIADNALIGEDLKFLAAVVNA